MIKEILLKNPRYHDEKISIWWYNNDATIEYGEEYERPEISFDQLAKIKEFFGAKDIKVKNGSSQAGCETCDWGSLYCVDIEIIGCTQNLGFSL